MKEYRVSRIKAGWLTPLYSRTLTSTETGYRELRNWRERFPSHTIALEVREVSEWVEPSILADAPAVIREQQCSTCPRTYLGSRPGGQCLTCMGE